MQRVLFADPVHGARSQMAEALLRASASDRYDVSSAGNTPGGSLDGVAQVLWEVGLDTFLPARRAISAVLQPPPDLLVLHCEEGCGSCPFVPGAGRVMLWPEPDPDLAAPDERLGVLRRIREDLQLHVWRFVNLQPI